MKLKHVLQYLLIYLVLAMLSVALALKFWWTDSLTLSSSSKQSLALIFSVQIMWMAKYFLSILIIRAIFMQGYNGFISPLKLSDEDFIRDIGIAKIKKVSMLSSILGFGLLFISIFVFVNAMSVYKNDKLRNNGISQTVVISEIKFDPKKNPYAHFKYYYNGQEYQTNLPLNQLKQGDSIEIIFSKDNPAIVDYK